MRLSFRIGVFNNILSINVLLFLLAPLLRQGDSVSSSGVGTYALHINETLLIWSPRVIKNSKNNFADPIKVAIFAIPIRKWCFGRAVRHRSAKPATAVRFR